MSGRPIRGIPCSLQTSTARRILGEVLDRIRAAEPRDYKRLLKVVRDVVSLSPEETEDGTLGEWKADKETEDVATWGYGIGPTPGIMYVNEQLSRRELIAVMAHELGHACTISKDLAARGSWLEDEWTSELTAHWYAFKRWRFTAALSSILDTLDRKHHGAWPGETFSTGQGTFVIGDDYVCRPLPKGSS